ncbi:Acyl carrier protein [Mycobacterium simulans]|uniref:Acyl carrier protein n=1 Tax=Mycobacterium simulans TaxID=627089 RepID=A0A7Z7IFW3_9MYCO|nr:acyl carrier protein [Mycobacterium simulans]SOJ52649.1 Acyl carrier protein [Mycobacterium simulans]
MTEKLTTPVLPEDADVVQAMRAGLVKLLPPEDLAQLDLDHIGSDTTLLSLPVDSVVLMALMNELEDKFTVYIDEEAAFAFRDIGDVANYVRQRLIDKARRLANS